MRHIHGDKDSSEDQNRKIYRKLGEKIDGMQLRAPWREEFYELIRELYSTDEADVVARMPYTFSRLDRIARVTGYNKSKLKGILDGLTSKGLVIDIFVNGEFVYMPSPLYVGIYEFTLMKTGGLSTKEKAKFLHAYMKDNDDFYSANFSGEKRVSIMRSIPHEETVMPEDYTEILDYEKAVALIEATDTYSLGNCSCRTEKSSVGEKECKVPLRSCMALGRGADYVIRNKIGEPASKSEMLEAVAISKEYSLVLNADNVQRNPRFICQCCYDCCMTLNGIRKFGYPHTVVTSNFIADIVSKDTCIGCGKCAKACPINAIEMVDDAHARSKHKKAPVIDKNICLGCGVCALNCKTAALRLVKREQKVIHPATTFERIIMQSLERGTLQNQIFDDPGSITHKTMRAIIGGFLRLDPVKKALMSDTLRSSFLMTMKAGARVQGRGWFLDL
jgi:Pyruvate/2-oxoacid:ferredoxin oxidoreductase delta subunit